MSEVYVISGFLLVTSEVYQWYMDVYMDSLKSTSGNWMTIGKV